MNGLNEQNLTGFIPEYEVNNISLSANQVILNSWTKIEQHDSNQQ